MSIIESLYHRCPIPVQSALVSGWGLAWYFRRYGQDFHRKVRALQANERLTKLEFEQLQLDSLNRVLQLARQSPYYSRVFRDAGIEGSFTSLEQLRRLPLLNKTTLRIEPKNLLTGPLPRGTKVYHSSGTTGTPTDIYYTRQFHQYEQAYFVARLRQWAGTSYRDKRAMFGVRKVCAFEQSRPPYWRYSISERLAYYSIYHLSPQNLTSYVDHLERWGPRVVMGYPSALNLVAKHVLDTGRSLSVAAAFTTSETVTVEARANIERAFQCKLFDQYGAVESTHFASQCEHGRYHVSPERGIIEILDGDQPAAPGQPGRVVVTGLENLLQPLIRYEIGDVAYWAEDQDCPCGRQMPIIGGIQGRYEDYCVTPDGRQILRFDPVFKGVFTIVEGQVVQEDHSRFTINVVPTNAFSEEDRLKLKHNFRQHAGDVAVEVVEMESIPRTKSGKFRAVINRTQKHPE